MQYIPCNSALLAQETLLLTKKNTCFAQRLLTARRSRKIFELRQNSISLKSSSEPKLFGEDLRATSASLPKIICTCYKMGGFLMV